MPVSGSAHTVQRVVLVISLCAAFLGVIQVRVRGFRKGDVGGREKEVPVGGERERER